MWPNRLDMGYKDPQKEKGNGLTVNLRSRGPVVSGTSPLPEGGPLRFMRRIAPTQAGQLLPIEEKNRFHMVW